MENPSKEVSGHPELAFDRLKAFLSGQMRMSHLYQPVMMRRLLLNGGEASRREIAQDILDRDPTQIEYYETIVRDMVGRVLASKAHLVDRKGHTYLLRDAATLSTQQIDELVALCDSQIAAYESRRGRAIWEHRRRGRRPIPGTTRYEVLKRASFRCELCGVSADERALEVDHIEPMSLGGINELSNFQALCYPCNASKRDRDDTDFRDLKTLYQHRDGGCAFCDPPAAEVVESNALAFARRDGFPVTAGHTLIIPRRHVPSYFELRQPELNAIGRLILSQKGALIQGDPTILGFNVGVNVGEMAGQTIKHCHIHLIARREGDVANPRGGVRNVIPGMGDYGRQPPPALDTEM
jgi:ATP adenylyltransferase